MADRHSGWSQTGLACILTAPPSSCVTSGCLPPLCLLYLCAGDNKGTPCVVFVRIV